MNEEIENQPTTKGSYATLRFFVDDQMLKADFTADTLTTPILEDQIQELLKQSDFSKHKFDEEVIQNLIINSEQNYNEQLSIEKHTDASYEIIVDKEQMNVAIKVEQAEGGDDLDFEQVINELIELSINQEFIESNCAGQ